jgi:hypothetical protein
MIFYCFQTKEGLYGELLRSKLAETAHIIDSGEEDAARNFGATSLPRSTQTFSYSSESV